MKLHHFAIISMVGIVCSFSLNEVGIAQQSPVHSFTAKLTGAAEVPARPATANGSALVTIYGQNRLCYKITTSGVSNLTAAHIHQGTNGFNGAIVVPLITPSENPTTHCTVGDPNILMGIIRNPSDYYVNVHAQTYPNGALRGQLTAKESTMGTSNMTK